MRTDIDVTFDFRRDTLRARVESQNGSRIACAAAHTSGPTRHLVASVPQLAGVGEQSQGAPPRVVGGRADQGLQGRGQAGTKFNIKMDPGSLPLAAGPG
jgi:hypothetical protein